jgi:hypothetical protein
LYSYKYENKIHDIMNIINTYTWFMGSDYTKEEIIQKHPSLKSIKLFDLVNGKSITNIIKNNLKIVLIIIL